MSIVSRRKRIEVLDLLRGFAIFGILLINIQSFGLPSVGYLNPFSVDLSIDQPWSLQAWVYYLSHIFADQKFMTILSILYGCGIALINHKRNSIALPYLLKRHFVLAVIGFSHAFFLWSGDILLSYAICGAIAVLFRRSSPRALMLSAALLFLVPVFISVAMSHFLPYLPPHEIESLKIAWAGSEESIIQEVASMHGSWSQIQEVRIEALKSMYLDVFPYYTLWRTTALMLVGIALFKSGFFEGRMPRKVLIRLSSLLSVFSLTLIFAGLYQKLNLDWDMRYTLFIGSLPNYFGSAILGFAYICWLMAFRNEIERRIRNALTWVGKTALSNYLLQSLVCGFIFYGYGLSWFNALNRLELLAVVIFVWCIQIFLSKAWLKNNRIGPVERLWRKAMSCGFSVNS